MGTDKRKDSVLRSCLPADCARLVTLLQATGLYEPSVDNEKAFQEKLRHDLESIIVVEQGGVILGMVVTVFDPWVASLWHLAVHPEHRGRGYGDALASEAERRLRKRGAQVVIGYVREGNIPSRSLFKKRNWGEFPLPIIPIEKKL